MNVSAFRVVTRVGAGLLAAATSCGALAAPVAVPPGANDLPIPTFSGSPPTVTLLGDTGPQTLTKQGVTVGFEEFAVDTSLNPNAVSIGFEISASNVPTSLDATLHGFGGFMLSAESCDTFLAMSSGVCGKQTGTVSRSPGHGENLMFSSLGTMAVTPPGGSMPINATNLYGIFSDASGFTHAPVEVEDDGKTFSFTGFAPSGTTSMPEPAALGLLGLGLLGSLLTGRGRRRAAPRQPQTGL